MTVEQTFSIIKPNAVAKNVIGAILNRFENIGLMIISAKMLQLNYEQAEGFYAEHKDKFFFDDLINFMISGPILVQVLEGQYAVCRTREIMGDTDPSRAQIGTIRAEYGDSFTENAVHGSDSIESAAREISYFFTEEEIYARTR